MFERMKAHHNGSPVCKAWYADPANADTISQSQASDPGETQPIAQQEDPGPAQSSQAQAETTSTPAQTERSEIQSLDGGPEQMQDIPRHPRIDPPSMDNLRYHTALARFGLPRRIGGRRVAFRRFPRPAGTPLNRHYTSFSIRLAKQVKGGQPIWEPFASHEEWSFARWLIRSGLSQGQINEHLKSAAVTDLRKAYPEKYKSFSDKASFFQCIDSLPGPTAEWHLYELTIVGTEVDEDGQPRTEILDLWMRNPVEVIADIIGNPAFKDHAVFEPVQKTAADGEGDAGEGEEEGIYDEMWSGHWWWNAQLKLPAGATVVPVILASDKTQLSTFSGDKQAWPVYLSIGNISKGIRRQPSKHAMVLLGYLPYSKLKCYRTKDERSFQGQRLFHYAMKTILEPLVAAGRDGVYMTCADGFNRRCYPLLAAYIADFPEQCLITCVKANRCSSCRVDPDKRGNLTDSLYRDTDETLAGLAQTPRPDDLRNVPEPFWAHLPLVNVFGCITPDILHQLHKGVFKDHLFTWTSKDVEREIDDRFARVPPYPGLRVFQKGLTSISQWTGNEYRQMEKVLIAVLCGMHDDLRVIRAARAILDFIYHAQYPSHTSTSIEVLQLALEAFHDNKEIFIIENLREQDHFDLPKLHAIQHYPPSILYVGSCDGTSTEQSERLHIDIAKNAYRATNRKDYEEQMVMWLQRQEKVNWMETYQNWAQAEFSTKTDTRSGVHTEAERASQQALESVIRTLATAGQIARRADEPDAGQDVEMLETAPEEVSFTSGSQLEQTTVAIDGVFSSYNNEKVVVGSGLARYMRGEVRLGSGDAVDQPPSVQTVTAVYRISKRPTLGYKTVYELRDELGAVSFAQALSTFLQIECAQADPDDLSPSTLSQWYYAVYRRFSRDLPLQHAIEQDALRDITFATPKQAGVARPPTFSTVLFIEDPQLASHVGIAGYRVGQVRVIFSLQEELAQIRPSTACRHLAYIELFTRFRSCPEDDCDLYKVQRSMTDLQRTAIVVPLDRIFRSCHLVPEFGKQVDRRWKSETVLEQCDTFYLNSFIDDHMYFFVE
ncbi:hypothetical protein PENSPDRAFT_598761 [Peniophora sp. CONT]|nr:hypothetical protein PENSPDRAFT_598761 [Peniophora sp. CONT]